MTIPFRFEAQAQQAASRIAEIGLVKGIEMKLVETQGT